jgi:hypothetical protein
VGLHNENSGLLYFTLKLQKILNSLQENFEKNNFCASFPFYFLYVFLVHEDLVSKYEQLLILTNIDGSTLYCTQGLEIQTSCSVSSVPITLHNTIIHYITQEYTTY